MVPAVNENNVITTVYLPSTPTPSTNTGVPTKRIGGLSAMDCTSLKPRFWKKWRRKAKRANRDAPSPVETQLPP